MTKDSSQDLADRLFSRRARIGRETLGSQSSVPIEGILNLGSGTPDFDTPNHIVEAAQEALGEGYTKYTPWPGYPDLREELSKKFKEENGLDFNPEGEIMVTTGTQEALNVIFQSFFEPGDEVVLPSPYYNEYVRWAGVSGAKLVPVNTTPENNFIVDPEMVKESITTKTKMIALTTPNNPTGTVLPEDVLKDIAEIAKSEDLLVLSDELYEYYTYDGNEHFSIGSLPGMKERTIVVNGFSKAFSMTGFRIGYLGAPAPYIEGMLPVKHSMSICVSAASQRAALAALQRPMDWWGEVYEKCKERRRKWKKALDNVGLSYGEPMGSYVFLVDASSVGMSGSEFARKLLEREKVRVGSGDSYGEAGEDFVRVSLMTEDDDLEEGLTRIKNFVREIS
ncbi:aminotransferase class I/II-fold pyridoxal phosphate-dependent enzyme [Candidatus Bipolaricaulota bacterium]|nr:aminotransferase class I/II-fold pyridoxal phosphate-dependent enzyme [Candidatus Bipolaricaulota bacterium]